jgi:ribosomal protein S11
MALQTVIYNIIRKLKSQKIWSLNLFLKNTGRGSRRIIKLLLKSKIKIKRIKDISTFAHNGCRSSTKRRL